MPQNCVFSHARQLFFGGEPKHRRGEVGLARDDGEHFPEDQVNVLRVDGQVAGRFDVLAIVEKA